MTAAVHHVVRTFESWSVDFGLISSLSQTNELKSWYSQLPCLTFSIKRIK